MNSSRVWIKVRVDVKYFHSISGVLDKVYKSMITWTWWNWMKQTNQNVFILSFYIFSLYNWRYHFRFLLNNNFSTKKRKNPPFFFLMILWHRHTQFERWKQNCPFTTFQFEWNEWTIFNKNTKTSFRMTEAVKNLVDWITSSIFHVKSLSVPTIHNINAVIVALIKILYNFGFFFSLGFSVALLQLTGTYLKKKRI